MGRTKKLRRLVNTQIDTFLFTFGPILDQQTARFRWRWRAIMLGLYSSLFWCGALTAASILVDKGLSFVAWGLLALWGIISLPVLSLQIALMYDVLQSLFTGSSVIYTRMHAFLHRVRSGALDPFRQPSLGDRVLMLAIRTSPLSGISTWCMYKLCTLGPLVHVTEETAPYPVSINAYSLQHDRWAHTTLNRLTRSMPSILAMYWVSFERNTQDRIPICLLPYKKGFKH